MLLRHDAPLDACTSAERRNRQGGQHPTGRHESLRNGRHDQPQRAMVGTHNFDMSRVGGAAGSETVHEAPRQLPKALLVALLAEDGAAGRVPELRQQHLSLRRKCIIMHDMRSDVYHGGRQAVPKPQRWLHPALRVGAPHYAQPVLSVTNKHECITAALQTQHNFWSQYYAVALHQTLGTGELWGWARRRTMQRVEPLESASSVDSAACSRASVRESGRTSSARGSVSVGAALSASCPDAAGLSESCCGSTEAASSASTALVST